MCIRGHVHQRAEYVEQIMHLSLLRLLNLFRLSRSLHLSLLLSRSLFSRLRVISDPLPSSSEDEGTAEEWEEFGESAVALMPLR